MIRRAARGTHRIDDEGTSTMRLRFFAKAVEVSAHCDLPCGVYDPAQARIEAQSVKATIEKALASDDPDFKTRAMLVKEQRSHLVKEHLWVLWTDYFKATLREVPPAAHAVQRGHQGRRRGGDQGLLGPG